MAAHKHSHIAPVRDDETLSGTSNNTTPTTPAPGLFSEFFESPESRSQSPATPLQDVTPRKAPTASMAGLFRQGFDTSDVRCLPFVQDIREGRTKRRSFWHCPPPSSDYRENLNTGQRFAGAYLTYQHINQGDSPSLLAFIVGDMRSRNEGTPCTFTIGFLSMIENYAMCLVKASPPAQIAHEIEAYMVRQRNHHEEFMAGYAAEHAKEQAEKRERRKLARAVGNEGHK